jgi:hypothetical protein
MGGALPVREVVDGLTAQLAQRLGEGYVVTMAHVQAPPRLAAELVRLIEDGVWHFVLLPVDLERPEETLREQVARAHIRELGAQIVLAPALATGDWPYPDVDAIWERLAAGENLETPPPADSRLLDILEERVRRQAPE